MSLTGSGGEACDEAWVCPVNLCFPLLESLETVKGHSPAMQPPGLWLSAQLVSGAQTKPHQRAGPPLQPPSCLLQRRKQAHGGAATSTDSRSCWGPPVAAWWLRIYLPM